MSRWSHVRCPHPSTCYLLRTVDLLRSRRTQGNWPRTTQSTGKLLGSGKQIPFIPVKIPVDKSIHQHSPSTLTRAGLFERCQLNHVLLYRIQQNAPRIYLFLTKQNTGSIMLSLEMPVLHHLLYRKKHNTARIFEIQVFTTTDLDGYKE